jgi:hypothetical protein
MLFWELFLRAPALGTTINSRCARVAAMPHNGYYPATDLLVFVDLLTQRRKDRRGQSQEH